MAAIAAAIGTAPPQLQSPLAAMVPTRVDITAVRTPARNSICASQSCGRLPTEAIPAALITAATANITLPPATADRVAALLPMADPAHRVMEAADVPQAAAATSVVAAAVDISAVVEVVVTPAAVAAATPVGADVDKAFSPALHDS